MSWVEVTRDKQTFFHPFLAQLSALLTPKYDAQHVEVLARSESRSRFALIYGEAANVPLTLIMNLLALHDNNSPFFIISMRNFSSVMVK